MRSKTWGSSFEGSEKGTGYLIGKQPSPFHSLRFPRSQPTEDEMRPYFIMLATAFRNSSDFGLLTLRLTTMSVGLTGLP